MSQKKKYIYIIVAAAQQIIRLVGISISSSSQKRVLLLNVVYTVLSILQRKIGTAHYSRPALTMHRAYSMDVILCKEASNRRRRPWMQNCIYSSVMLGPCVQIFCLLGSSSNNTTTTNNNNNNSNNSNINKTLQRQTRVSGLLTL